MAKSEVYLGKITQRAWKKETTNFHITFFGQFYDEIPEGVSVDGNKVSKQNL